MLVTAGQPPEHYDRLGNGLQCFGYEYVQHGVPSALDDVSLDEVVLCTSRRFFFFNILFRLQVPLPMTAVQLLPGSLTLDDSIRKPTAAVSLRGI